MSYIPIHLLVITLIITVTYVYCTNCITSQFIENNVYGLSHPTKVSEIGTNTNSTIPWLGLTFHNITKKIANLEGVEKGTGVIIMDVTPGGPAESTGLKGGKESQYLDNELINLGGDIIISVDNNTIKTEADLLNILYQKKVGETIQIHALRNNQQLYFNVPVGALQVSVMNYDESIYSNPDDINFTTYSNSNLGLKVYYPSVWSANEENKSNQGVELTFRSPYAKTVNDPQEYLKLYSYPSYLGRSLDDVISIKTPLQNLQIVSPVNDTTLLGNPARMIVYTFTDDKYGTTKAMKIATEIEGKIFMATFFGSESEFNVYLPTIHTMLSLLNFIDYDQYENFDAGVRFEFPSTWNIKVGNTFMPNSYVKAQNITILTSEDNSSDIPHVQFEILASDELQDVEDSFYDLIKYYESLNKTTNLYKFELITSPLRNNSIHDSFNNITYSYRDPVFGLKIESHMIVIANDRLYSISFGAEKDKYLSNISIINKIIDSIKFIQNSYYLGSKSQIIFEYPSDIYISDKDNEISLSFGPVDTERPFVDPKFTIDVNKKTITKLHSTDNVLNVTKNKVYLNTTQEEKVLGEKTEFLEKGSNNTIQVMLIEASLNNNSYIFMYSAEPDDYHKYESSIEEIINTTRLVDLIPKIRDSSNTTELSFQHYDSPYGYKIVYPINWQITDYGSGVVDFTEIQSNRIIDNIINSGYDDDTIRIAVTPSENTSLNELIRNDMMYFTDLYKDLKIIQTSSTNHHDSSSFEVLYESDDSLTLQKYVFDKRNHYNYYITYSNGLPQFYKTLPIVQKMIDSIQFTGVVKPSTYTGYKVGDGPMGIAVNPKTNLIYVTNSLSNTISVISGSDDKIIKNISTAFPPLQVVVNPSTNKVYVSHQGSVSIIEGLNNTLIDNIPISSRDPMAMSVNPNTNYIFVGDGISKNVSAIDGIENKELAIISTGISIDSNMKGIGISVDELRNKIYVANPSTNNITIIDGSNYKILSNVHAYIHPYDIAINPTSSIGYIVGETSLAQIDLSTNKIQDVTIPNNLSFFPSFNMVSINPVSNAAYIPDLYNNVIYKIDSENTTYITTIRVDEMPMYLAINPDTDIVYVSNYRSDTITQIDGGANKVIYGVRFDIIDEPSEYNILGINLAINHSKNAKVYCEEDNMNRKSIVDGEYVRYKNGTNIGCLAVSKNTFLPLFSTSWSGLINDHSLNFTVDRYGTIRGSFIDWGNFLQTLSPIISYLTLITVIALSVMHCLINRSKISLKEKLEKLDIIAIDAAVIVGVLIFLSLTDGFEANEQTQITVITVNIVFPFAISAVIAIRNQEHFAMTFMIAGFLNLMISVFLVALMRL